MDAKKKKVLVIGVIGADVHAVGNKILYHAFTEAGFEVVNLGVMVSQEEYIAAAIESNADAIVISSRFTQERDCGDMKLAAINTMNFVDNQSGLVDATREAIASGL